LFYGVAGFLGYLSFDLIIDMILDFDSSLRLFP